MWTSVAEAFASVAAAIGLKTSFFVGLIGAVISLRYVPEMKTWWERVSTVVGGALCANYVAPLVVGWFDLKSPGGEASFAFLIGLFGMSLASAALKLIQDGSIWQLIKTKFGGTNA